MSNQGNKVNSPVPWEPCSCPSLSTRGWAGGEASGGRCFCAWAVAAPLAALVGGVGGPCKGRPMSESETRTAATLTAMETAMMSTSLGAMAVALEALRV